MSVDTVNPFANSLITVSGQMNKTCRDNTKHTHNPTITRFLLPWDESLHISTQLLSHKHKKTEFPKINPNYMRRKNFSYWAITWFTDLQNYASMAVVKQDVCKGGEAIQWSKPNWYPSEPMMIPKPGSKLEDDGLVVFTAVDGVGGHAYFITLDAKTMTQVSQVGPYSHISFPAHGAFYPKP